MFKITPKYLFDNKICGNLIIIVDTNFQLFDELL